jgi:hypothetical protein
MSERERDVFDDLEALRVEPPSVARAPVNGIVVPARERQTQPFGMIGLALAKELGGVTCIVVHLAHQMVLSGGKPVPATAARTGCSDKRTRLRALRLLERLGRVEIEWRRQGAAPLVKWFSNV